ncbi:chorismate mutase [Xylocopilactobacillus apis]|uniref:Chorismate mutase domain-containing protein n=1 Tax=Xylocopilactobacillus apis TaxID=2932183 RepID=A0AAU9DGA0_9LACO|nr:chorismate mutase [Xylocopilactobacillus apis]BDR57286.1 hypothetical protein KIMC2_18480 [Xylocopilactobacillus apis]
MKERDQIDQIDQKMTILFEQRMELSKKIAANKIEQKEPVLDQKREKEIIEKEISNLNDENLKQYLTDFYRDLFLISRQYQANLIKGWRDTK